MTEETIRTVEPTLRFPDWRDEAFARAQQFRSLSSQDRHRYMCDVYASGQVLLRNSPKLAWADEMFAKRESEWRRIQAELLSHAE